MHACTLLACCRVARTPHRRSSANLADQYAQAQDNLLLLSRMHKSASLRGAPVKEPSPHHCGATRTKRRRVRPLRHTGPMAWRRALASACGASTEQFEWAFAGMQRRRQWQVAQGTFYLAPHVFSARDV